MRITGEGESGDRGGPPGDLYIFIGVEEHAFFKREGSDLYCQVPLTFPQAALGTRLLLKTLDGEVEVAVPAGAQPGQQLRVASRGIPKVNRAGRGDLFVILEVQGPKRLSKEEKRLYEDLLHLEKDREEKGGFFKKVLGRLADGR
jgi:molecular chaperone DnaJ